MRPRILSSSSGTDVRPLVGCALLLVTLAACGTAAVPPAADHPLEGTAQACDFTTPLDDVPAHQLRRCAQAARNSGDTRHGSGDEQRLAVFVGNGQLEYGPYAKIAPVRNFGGVPTVVDIPPEQLARGFPLAVVESSGSYDSLGFERGTNVVIGAVAPGATRGVAWVVPVDNPANPTRLVIDVQTHPDSANAPLPAARWVWSRVDDTMWVSCSGACCGIKRAYSR